MKKIVLMAMMIATGMSATAQDEVETTVSADIVSSYICVARIWEVLPFSLHWAWVTKAFR